MRRLSTALLVVGGALLGYSLLRWVFARARRFAAALATPSNQEWLARILLTEAGDIDDEEEWAGIAWVAMNRAAQWKAQVEGKMARGEALSSWALENYPDSSVRAVVATSGWFGDTPPARLSSDGILQGRRAAHALEFAGRLLSGVVSNPVGDRTHFVHPSGMPRCGPEGERTKSRVCRQTAYGLRWMPYWAIDPVEGGSAEYTPVGQGRAVFADLAGLGYRSRGDAFVCFTPPGGQSRDPDVPWSSS